MGPEPPPPQTIAFTSASLPDHYEQLLVPIVFTPWARVLLDCAGLAAGDRVLDVASGTGVVARLAAERVGGEGRVIASDVSESMLGRSRALTPAQAPIEFAPAPAQDIPLPDGAVDVVVCQQGLQFFPDRPAALREMLRVTRAGGVLALAVWSDSRPLEPFDRYGEALDALGADEPFPGAFASGTFALSAAAVGDLLDQAGWSEVEVEVAELDLTWPDAATAARGIHGTPFATLVDELPDARRQSLYAALERSFAPAAEGGPVTRRSASVIARAVAPARR